MATDNKYDRQLRLWGAQGQKALSEAHVLLLGAGPAGTETLKNLVLPGVGRFTVVDGEKVEERDTGNNFFVRKSDIGRPRAAAGRRTRRRRRRRRTIWRRRLWMWRRPGQF